MKIMIIALALTMTACAHKPAQYTQPVYPAYISYDPKDATNPDDNSKKLQEIVDNLDKDRQEFNDRMNARQDSFQVRQQLLRIQTNQTQLLNKLR